jgi:hypothetical protein
MRVLSDFGWIDGFLIADALDENLLLHCDGRYLKLAASGNDLRNGEAGSYFS